MADSGAEVQRLQAIVVQLQRQLEHSGGPATTAGANAARQRLREDFVPNCVEEMQQWIWDRRQDLQEATMAVRPAEVGRISQFLAQGAQEHAAHTDAPMTGSSPSMLPSTVGLMVRWPPIFWAEQPEPPHDSGCEGNELVRRLTQSRLPVPGPGQPKISQSPQAGLHRSQETSATLTPCPWCLELSLCISQGQRECETVHERDCVGPKRPQVVRHQQACWMPWRGISGIVAPAVNHHSPPPDTIWRPSLCETDDDQFPGTVVAQMASNPKPCGRFAEVAHTRTV